MFSKGNHVYLFLAFFWLVIGVLLQLFWTTLQPFAHIPVDRNIISFVCFMLFSYNLVRWRMSRVLLRDSPRYQDAPPRPRRGEPEYNPAFDFSDPKPDDESKAKPQ